MQINDSVQRCFVFLLEGKQSLKERAAATEDDKQTRAAEQQLAGHVTDIEKNKKTPAAMQ